MNLNELLKKVEAISTKALTKGLINKYSILNGTKYFSPGILQNYLVFISAKKSLINKYKWKGINYPSKIDDWKTIEKNNPTIAINILYIKEKEICPAYISKINLQRRLALSCSKNATCIT